MHRAAEKPSSLQSRPYMKLLQAAAVLHCRQRSFTARIPMEKTQAVPFTDA